MPHPVPLRRSIPNHLAPPPKRDPETNEQRRTRQLDFLRELGELNMIAARDAVDRIVNDAPADADAPAASDPTLALARATRAVTSVINVEDRIAAGEPAPAPAALDPRNIALRELLLPMTNREALPTRRRALRIRVIEQIEDALGADLEDDIALADIARVICAEHGFPLDLAKLPDRYIFPFFAGAPKHRFQADDPHLETELERDLE